MLPKNFYDYPVGMKMNKIPINVFSGTTAGYVMLVQDVQSTTYGRLNPTDLTLPAINRRGFLVQRNHLT